MLNQALIILLIKYELFFSFEPVSVEDMKKVVLSFKDSSPGHDDVPMRLIKRNINVLADVLVYICNLSFHTGIFPKALMLAVIKRLFKSGKVNCFENYRAKSILVACSKILEKNSGSTITPLLQTQ